MNNATDRAARLFNRTAARKGMVVGTVLVTDMLAWDDGAPTVNSVQFMTGGKIIPLQNIILACSQRTMTLLDGLAVGDTAPFVVAPSELRNLTLA